MNNNQLIENFIKENDFNKGILEDSKINSTEEISYVIDKNGLYYIIDEIKHFFGVYKQLEGKTMKVLELHNAEEAKEVVQRAVDEYISKFLSLS